MSAAGPRRSTQGEREAREMSVDISHDAAADSSQDDTFEQSHSGTESGDNEVPDDLLHELADDSDDFDCEMESTYDNDSSIAREDRPSFPEALRNALRAHILDRNHRREVGQTVSSRGSPISCPSPSIAPTSTTVPGSSFQPDTLFDHSSHESNYASLEKKIEVAGGLEDFLASIKQAKKASTKLALKAHFKIEPRASRVGSRRSSFSDREAHRPRVSSPLLKVTGTEGDEQVIIEASKGGESAS